MAKDDKKTEPTASPSLASAPSSPSPDAGDSTASQLAALRLQLEQERRARADAEAFAKRAADAADAMQAQLRAAGQGAGATAPQRAKPKVVPGVKYYRINAPHYRHGALIPAGSVVRVEDEAPSKTWVEVKPQKGAVPLLKQLAPEVPDEADLPTPEEAAAGEAESAGKAKLGKGI